MSARMVRFDGGARKALLQLHVKALKERQSKITDLHMLIEWVKLDVPIQRALEQITEIARHVRSKVIFREPS